MAAALRLEANDIIVNYNLLPTDTDARNPSGLRVGVQEMTRYGMREADVQDLAGLIAGRHPRQVRQGRRARPAAAVRHGAVCVKE